MSLEPSVASEAASTAAAPRRTYGVAYWIGWVFTVLPAGMLIMSGVMKLAQPPDLAKGFEHLGIPFELAVPIGIVEIASAVIYLFPPTAMLGAILLTGYLGGAIMTHLRLLEPIHVQVILGVVIWLGLYLREPRLHPLVFWRR